MPTATDLRVLLKAAGARDVPEPRAEFITELETFLIGETAATDEVRELLEDAGERDVPTPRPEFVAGLEARLLEQATTIARPIPLVARAGRPEPRRVVPAMLSAAAAVAAIVLGAALGGVFGQDPAQRQLELTSAIGTEIVLPDGETIAPDEGQDLGDLPDGTQIKTGAEGSVVIDDGGTPVKIGPNQVATIDVDGDGVTVSIDPLPPVSAPLPPTPTTPLDPLLNR